MREAFEHDIESSKRKREPGVLIGVRNICKYVRIGPQTFYKLHTYHDFPATRLPDCRWCTSRNLIDEWIVSRWKAQKGHQNPVTPMSPSVGESMESVA